MWQFLRRDCLPRFGYRDQVQGMSATSEKWRNVSRAQHSLWMLCFTFCIHSKAYHSDKLPFSFEVLKLEVLAKTAWADQGCGFIEAHRTASQKCHTLFYTSLYTLYSIPLSTHSILNLSLHTLFYTSLYTLYSIPLSTHSILNLSLHTLFYTSLYTLYSIPLSRHSILYLSLHTLFYTSLYTLYSIPLPTHSILYLSLHTLFYTSLYTLYSIPLSTHLFYTSLYTLYSIPLSTSEIARKKITWTQQNSSS